MTVSGRSHSEHFLIIGAFSERRQMIILAALWESLDHKNLPEFIDYVLMRKEAMPLPYTVFTHIVSAGNYFFLN